MAQSAYTIRLDSDIKQQFDSLCEDFGMSANTAFSIFVKSVIRNRKIPFEIEATPKSQQLNEGMKAFSQIRSILRDKGQSEMTLDEINQLISDIRSGKEE